MVAYDTSLEVEVEVVLPNIHFMGAEDIHCDEEERLFIDIYRYYFDHRFLFPFAQH